MIFLAGMKGEAENLQNRVGKPIILLYHEKF